MCRMRRRDTCQGKLTCCRLAILDLGALLATALPLFIKLIRLHLPLPTAKRDLQPNMTYPKLLDLLNPAIVSAFVLLMPVTT